MTQTHYQILGVTRNATQNEIKLAYRAKVRQYHPDSFSAEMQRLKVAGLIVPLRALEQEVQEAKRKTQQINLAYATLSDPDKRRTYDLTLSDATNKTIGQQQRQSRHRHPERQRRTVKARPHRTPQERQAAGVPATTNGEKIVFGFLAAFILSLIFLFSQISNFLNRPLYSMENNHYSAAGAATLTARANQAALMDITRTAREARATRAAALPTDTMTMEERARNFVEAGMVDLAIDAYTSAIRRDPRNADLYFERGHLYHQSIGNTDPNLDDPAGQALSDYNRAIILNDDAIAIYAERGLLRYQIIQTPQLLPAVVVDESFIQRTRGDLLFYLQNTDDPRPEVIDALADLNGQ